MRYVRTGNTVLNTIFLTIFFTLIFYLSGFFLRFQIGNFTSVSLSFLVVFLSISSFTFGVFFVSRHNLDSTGNLLMSLVVLSLFLFFLTLIASAGTNVFLMISLIATLPLLFHLFILGVFVKRFLEVRVSGPVIASIAKPGERRTEARIKDYVSTQYLSPQGNWRVIKVYDLSARGMRLVLDKPLPLSELVELKIIIPYDSRPVFAKGKVIWSKELSVQEREFHVGLVFTQIDPGDKSRLILKQVYSLFREGVA